MVARPPWNSSECRRPDPARVIPAIVMVDAKALRRGLPARLGRRCAIVVAAWLVGLLSHAGAAPPGFRPLAPGVLTVVPPDIGADDTVQRGDIVEITEGLKRVEGHDWTPAWAAANTTLVQRARNLEFTRKVWCLEFAFKPPRTIDIDVPVAEGRMAKRRVWYLMYRVRNTGGRHTVVDGDEAGDRSTGRFEEDVLFLPHFVLESREGLGDSEGLVSYRAYLDRVCPAALEPIRRKENPPAPLLDSAAISATKMAPGEERWGVAVWEDVDPRIDFFSIFVRGLTNAFRSRRRATSVVRPGDPPGAGLEFALESLRLDFWRPGDARPDRDEEMSVGFAGMFERMTLGGRINEAIGRSRLLKARPGDGLEQLGLSWSELLEHDDAGTPNSLVPLETALRKLATMPDPEARGRAVRDLFGDPGDAWIEELARALAGPAEPERDAERRAALAKARLTPEDVSRKPLEAMAAILRVLEEAPDIGERRTRARAFFGPAARRVDALASGIAAARTLAALEDLEIREDTLAAGDALAAFDAVRTAIDAEADADRRQKLVAGLFGARGPELYAAATAVHEGVDHAWVFRFEQDPAGL